MPHYRVGKTEKNNNYRNSVFSQLFFLPFFFNPRLLNTQNEKEKPQTETQLNPSWDHCSVYLGHSHTPLVPVCWELATDNQEMYIQFNVENKT